MVWTAEATDRRIAGEEPGQVGKTDAGGFDDAMHTFLGVVYADLWSPTDTAPYEKEDIAAKECFDRVERHGKRVIRQESRAKPDDGELSYVGQTVVSECATVDEVNVRFHVCAAELWRSGQSGDPDPAIVGVIQRSSCSA